MDASIWLMALGFALLMVLVSLAVADSHHRRAIQQLRDEFKYLEKHRDAEHEQRWHLQRQLDALGAHLHLEYEEPQHTPGKWNTTP